MRRAIAAVLCLWGAGWAAAQDTGPTVIDPGPRAGDLRTPIAVPYFLATPDLHDVAKEMSNVVVYDLDFTGLFRLMLPSEFPRGFTSFPPDPAQVDFDAWRQTAADYLVHGVIRGQGNMIQAELRLLDVATGQQVMGQRYTEDKSLLRLIAHRFSDEVTKYATGTLGIATSRIAFSSGSGGVKEIYIADYDGKNVKQLTRHGSISITPKFSPDGTKIAYVSYKDRYPWLYVLDVNSGAVTPLAQHVGVNIAPSWAPDSRSLAIVLSKDANLEIYRVNVDGSGLRRLTDHKAIDTSPTFSPDGSRIAFVSERGGPPQIWVMGADGSNPRRLSMTYGKAFDPNWSPDGARIAFVSDNRGVHIAVMNADGSNVRTLTSQGTNEAPVWSPDSRHIMFHRTQGKQLRVVDVGAQRTRDREITIGMPVQTPSWGPRR